MTKTRVSKHPRKGTKGVKRHSRAVPSKKSVPHNTKKTISINKFIKELDLELTQFEFFDSKTNRHQEITSFNDIPENIRNKKWNFEVEIDRTPVPDSQEFAFIKIEGSRVTGKKRQAKRTGINLSKMRLQPMGYEMVDTYQSIDIDTRMINPIYDYEEDEKEKIKDTIQKTLKSNFPNKKRIKYKWEDKNA